ncbi:MAG: hypothetical protein GC189_12450 [Alphaproteobacteria bacterium]|nr:hypothetical protein [Alphaproteobacteria bacterium]
MDNAIGWYASVSGIIAAIIIATNIGRRATGWAFGLFCTSSLAWILAGLMDDQASILWQNIVLLLTNMFGVYRWLLRQDKPPATSQDAA